MKNRLLHLLGCLLIGTTVAAQSVTNSNSLISIQQNTVFAATDFVNNGTVINNGNLVISGAWTNEGTYQAGTGQVTFNSSGTQIINHNDQSFDRLTISGGGQKIFNADIQITDELILQDGLLVSGNLAKIILLESAVVTGGSGTAYVQGPFYNTGLGQKIFPVGINAHYLPLVLTDVTGTSPVVGVEVVEPNTNVTFNKSLTGISSLRYWKLTVGSGTFSGSPVVLPLLDETLSAASENIVVAQAASLNDPFESLGQSDFSGTVQAGAVTSEASVTQVLLTVGETTNNNSKALTIYNVVTPNNDGIHDFLKIINIEYYPDNVVTVVNRWGDKIFEMRGYDNVSHVFAGEGNTGGVKSLTDGTYYYVIDKGNGDKKVSGFFLLSR